MPSTMLKSTGQTNFPEMFPPPKPEHLKPKYTPEVRAAELAAYMAQNSERPPYQPIHPSRQKKEKQRRTIDASSSHVLNVIL